jgi:glycerol uptake facilitator-like aquaporin
MTTLRSHCTSAPSSAAAAAAADLGGNDFPMHSTGGHLNPAITIAMFLTSRISLIRAIIYVVCQLAGAIVGSAPVRAVDPFGFGAALGASNRLNSWANVGTGLGAELILTAIFVFVVFCAVDQTRGANSAHLPVLAPLASSYSLRTLLPSQLTAVLSTRTLVWYCCCVAHMAAP